MQGNRLRILKDPLPQTIIQSLTPKAIGYVNMGFWGCTNPKEAGFLSSLDTYLITHGAASCLNVIVHNADTSYGCLTHIPHGTTLDDQDQSKLYIKATKIIRGLIGKCRKSGENDRIEIWMGSGYAFVPGSNYSPQNPMHKAFPAYLSEQLGGLANINYLPSDIIANAPAINLRQTVKVPDSGHVLYLPNFATAYILSTEEWISLNINMEKVAAVGGSCNDFL